jgi:hypothetical protein
VVGAASRVVLFQNFQIARQRFADVDRGVGDVVGLLLESVFRAPLPSTSALLSVVVPSSAATPNPRRDWENSPAAPTEPRAPAALAERMRRAEVGGAWGEHGALVRLRGIGTRLWRLRRSATKLGPPVVDQTSIRSDEPAAKRQNGPTFSVGIRL